MLWSEIKASNKVTILILIDGFLQYCHNEATELEISVTILILIDGFLQYVDGRGYKHPKKGSQSLF